jgi:hypothetical protein
MWHLLPTVLSKYVSNVKVCHCSFKSNYKCILKYFHCEWKCGYNDISSDIRETAIKNIGAEINLNRMFLFWIRPDHDRSAPPPLSLLDSSLQSVWSCIVDIFHQRSVFNCQTSTFIWKTGQKGSDFFTKKKFM